MTNAFLPCVLILGLLVGAASPAGADEARPTAQAASGYEPAPTDLSKPLLPIVVARWPDSVRARLDRNVIEILSVFDKAGAPIAEDDRQALAATKSLPDNLAIGQIQLILDKYALLAVILNDEAWFQVVPASMDPKARPLIKGRWATFLVKVNNDSRVTSPLDVSSNQAMPDVVDDKTLSDKTCQPVPHDWSRWFLMSMPLGSDIPKFLSGQEVEYRVLRLCSLDAGDRAADFTFFLGGGQVSQGHYGSAGLLFRPTDAAGP